MESGIHFDPKDIESVLETRSQVRRKYSKIGVNKLVRMITPTGKFVHVNSLISITSHNFIDAVLLDGKIQALSPNDVVSQSVLEEIYSWMSQGCTIEDVIGCLRP